MYVLIGDIELYLHGVRNLKEKRMVLNSCKDQLKRRFDIIAREDRFTDKWQRTSLVCVSAAGEKDFLSNLFNSAVEFITVKYDVDILDDTIEIVAV